MPPRPRNENPHDKIPPHPESQQYQGLFKGLGVSSRQAVCNVRMSEMKKIQTFGTHFAIGCHKWDTKARGPSTTRSEFQDPGVAYVRRDAPQKNASVIEMRQGGYDGTTHFRTEQRERFSYEHGPQPVQKSVGESQTCSQVYLGDDKPELVSHSNAVHASVNEPDALDYEMDRAAGVGARQDHTTAWPKPVRCNPIHGGPRNADYQDLHPDCNFSRVSANCSNIVMVPNVRDPILGHHVPKSHFQIPGHKSTFEVIADHNTAVPPLRSLAAVRPHLTGPHANQLDRSPPYGPHASGAHTAR